MAKKGSLFLLIKSLTKSEKRYLKLHMLNGKADANHIRLFDLVDKQQEWNEAVIKKAFEGEAFAKQLHVTKIYLAELIMRSLRNYHTDSSVTTQLLDLLRDIEILFDKELYDHCQYQIEKAEKLATMHERQALLIEINSWKRRLLIARSAQDRTAIGSMLQTEQEAITKLGHLNEYWSKTLNPPRTLLSWNLPKELNAANASTLQSIVLHHHLLYLYYFMNNQPGKAEKEITKLISILEQHPHRIKDDPSSYVTAISNKISILFREKRWKDIEQLMQRMRQVPEQYKLNTENKFTIRLWLRIYNLELELYRDTQQLDKGLKLAKEVAAYIDKHDKAIPGDYRIMLQFQLATLYFYNNDLSKSLDLVNEMMNTNFGDVRNDLQCFVRILNLMIHFELKNIMVLRYAIDNARRFFKKKTRDKTQYEPMLSMFSALTHAAPPDYKSILRKTHAELYSKNSATALAINDYINMEWWLKKCGNAIKR